MKKIIILTLLACAVVSYADIYAPYVDSSETYGLWHFDSVRSNKYVDDDDSVAVDRNATMILAPNPIDTAGGPTLVDPVTAGFGSPGGNSAFGNCIYLNGSSQWMVVAQPNISVDHTDLRVESWFKADAAVDNQVLFDRWGQMVVFVESSRLRVLAWDGDNAVQTINANYSTVNADPTEWTHFAVEVYGDDVEVYLNDTLAAAFTLSNGLYSTIGRDTFFGMRYNNTLHFGGYIDEFRLSAVPEPATLALFGIGMAVIARRRRRV